MTEFENVEFKNLKLDDVEFYDTQDKQHKNGKNIVSFDMITAPQCECIASLINNKLKNIGSNNKVSNLFLDSSMSDYVFNRFNYRSKCDIFMKIY